MMSLFSSFDLFFFNIHWVLMFFVTVSWFNVVYLNSYMINLIKAYHNFMGEFLETLNLNMFTAYSKLMFFCSMIIIMFLNFFSILPFNFSYTSQISIVLTFSLGLWGAFIIFNIYNNIKGFLSHCVPEGTPIFLVWFLFLIEMVSMSIRPITLTIRLVANILAGHLLMILLSQLVMKFFPIIFLYMFLNLVELFVALIQSYIFVTMMCLYLSDVS